MNRLKQTILNSQRRKARVRSKLTGTTDRPRLSVHISNRQVTAQVIDDVLQKTVAHVTTSNVKLLESKTMTEKASWAGSEIAKQALKAKISTIVFDRNGKLYHGKVKALAEAARKEGLKF